MSFGCDRSHLHHPRTPRPSLGNMPQGNDISIPHSHFHARLIMRLFKSEPPSSTIFSSSLLFCSRLPSAIPPFIPLFSHSWVVLPLISNEIIRSPPCFTLQPHAITFSYKVFELASMTRQVFFHPVLSFSPFYPQSVWFIKTQQMLCSSERIDG